MMTFQPGKIAIFIAFLAISACSPKVNNHGYMRDGDVKDQVVVGKSTKDDVLAELGSPSALSSFGAETWYYISSRQEALAFMAPEVTEQDVLRIEFSPEGVVSAVASYNKDNAKEFDVVKRTTPTEGHSFTVMEQMLGNIGRFNSPQGRDSISGPRGY
jgi:outer membrane protein assembly factor BamE (lipoprotein component of BamABCDE complex)